MTQPDVVLTDYALALECVAFACLLLPARRSSPVFTFWFCIFFLATGVAAAAGGTFHGFFEVPGSWGNRILWLLTLIIIGVAALSGTRIAAQLHFSALNVRRISLGTPILFLAYCAVVLFFTRNFLVAIVAYLPVTLFLGWAFLRAYGRTADSAFLKGFAGICVLLLAAGMQQARLGIHPRYFNYNAVYHVLQAVGMFMIFITARDVCKANEVAS